MLAELLKEGYSVESVFPGPARGGPARRQRQRNPVDRHQLRARDHRTAAEPDRRHRPVDQHRVRPGRGPGSGRPTSTPWPRRSGSAPSELPGAYPSQVLGTADVSPLEMAAAYATFADGGVYHAPLLITKVTDRQRAGRCPCRSRRSAGSCSPRPRPPWRPTCLQQVVLRGTGTSAGDVGTAGGRQDGHDRELERRLVHRLHPAPDHRGVDGLRVGLQAHGQLPRADQRAGRDHPGRAVAQLHGRRPGVGAAARRDRSRWCTTSAARR